VISADPSHRDLAWRGYSGWAMLPSFTVCVLLSLALLTGSWFFEDMRGIGQEVGMLIFFAATMVIWVAQLFRWLYRGATYIYRLTPASLFVDRGFLYRPEAAVELGDITSVHWGSNALNRFFGVGWVVLSFATREPVTLTGILRPAAFAEEIQAAKNAATT
jgi:membrane protein YdbS with pleckstrin-like domain